MSVASSARPIARVESTGHFARARGWTCISVPEASGRQPRFGTQRPRRVDPSGIYGKQMFSEAAPRTDKACTAPVPGASLPGALYLSQPRTFTLETTIGNSAQL